MNDIDAGKESYGMYTGSSDAAVTCSHNLSEDMVFDGNGHTIYNLKTGIWRYNSGTVRNLNVSIHDTQEDGKHLSDYGGAMYVGNVNYFGIAQVNTGTIENCNVTIRSTFRTSISSTSAASPSPTTGPSGTASPTSMWT